MLQLALCNSINFMHHVNWCGCTGRLNVLDYLINELGEDPVAKDKDGMTSIHTATQNEMVPTVKVRERGKKSQYGH